MLVNKDALYSYFLLASYVQYHQQQISNTQL